MVFFKKPKWTSGSMIPTQAVSVTSQEINQPLITIRRRAVDLIPHHDAYNHLNSKPL
jgi:hypothetical protein